MQSLLLACGTDIDVLYQKNVCDEVEFYKPYVRLLRTRQPNHENSPILKLHEPGFLDVSKHTGILCINGPAIVYTDLSQWSECSKRNESQQPAGWMPSKGHPELFNHECFSFNRLSREFYEQEGHHREIKVDSKVYGNKVFGVYLLGTSPDYRMSKFTFFPRPSYGYSRANDDQCINDGVSLAFMASSTESSSHCYSIAKGRFEGVIAVRYPGKPVFCFRDGGESDFDAPFHSSRSAQLMTSQVKWTTNCGSAAEVGRDEPSFSVREFEPDPLQLPDFRIIDPLLQTGRGSNAMLLKSKRKFAEIADTPIQSKPHPVGGLFNDEPGWTDPSDYELKLTPAHLTSELNPANFPHQRLVADMSIDDCEEVPFWKDICISEYDAGTSCTIISHILTLEGNDWSNDVMKLGSWRKSIFNMINKLYEKTCPQVSKHVASSLSSIFQHFTRLNLEANETLKAQFNQNAPQEWIEIMSGLGHCLGNATPLAFFKKKDTAAVKLKDRLGKKLETIFERIAKRRLDKGSIENASKPENSKQPFTDPLPKFSSPLANDPEHTLDLIEIARIQEQLDETLLKYPFKILVGSPGIDGYDGAYPLYHFREAAEVDYEFNWALDTYWKIVTTVLGYCYSHFVKTDNTSATYIVDTFSRDLFQYITDSWIQPENQNIYEHIFGEFVHGVGSLWIDACQDGAYQWSDILELRPLRPLPLLEGDVPLSLGTSQQAPLNFFLDNPAHFKQTDDYYDDNIGKSTEGSSLERYEPHKKELVSIINLHNESEKDDIV